MKPADALADLLARVAASDGAAAMFSERELGEWPAAAVDLLKAEKLLIKGPPADTVTCPGCEEDCTMPVEVAVTPGGKLRAFVMCDKRDDVGRVPVATDVLEQWSCSPERLADAIARMLGLRRGKDDRDVPSWEVGLLKGVKNSDRLVLAVGDDLQLHLGGHTLALADVLGLGDNGLSLDRQALLGCLGNPISVRGDAEASKTVIPLGVGTSACAEFRSMKNLRSHEVSIALVGDKTEGLAGNNMLEIRARGLTRRVSLAEFDLVDHRTGAVNTQAAMLIGLANGQVLRRSQEAYSASMKRLRSAMRTHLGLTDDPFHRYQEESGWLPRFTLTDKRGLADQRAEVAAERRTVSYDQLEEAGIQFGDMSNEESELDSDEAAQWLQAHDARNRG